MAYTILIGSKAERSLKKQTGPILSQLKAKILSLSDNPKPRLSKALNGTQTGIRLMVHGCKILYNIDEITQEITIYKINKRRKPYSGL